MQELILNHYPPVIKQMKEIQQIAKAEGIEFSKLYASMDKVTRNMFIYTADESGVARFERMLGITPKAAQSLDDRKVYLIFMMNRKKMGMSELTAMLSGYCSGIKLGSDIANMEMMVEMGAGTISIDTISDILEETLPLGIYFHFAVNMGQARLKVLALHGAGASLKVKPLLEKHIKAAGQGSIRPAVFISMALKVRPLPGTGYTGQPAGWGNIREAGQKGAINNAR